MLSLCSRWFTKAWNPWFWDTPRYGAPRTELFEQLELAVSVMDHSGTLVTLPFDLRIPFSRYIARNGVVNMKRFDIGCVYRMRVSDACIGCVYRMRVSWQDVSGRPPQVTLQVCIRYKLIERPCARRRGFVCGIRDINESPWSMVYNHQHFSGLIFQFVAVNKRKRKRGGVDILAAGGRYDKLINYFRLLGRVHSPLPSHFVIINLLKVIKRLLVLRAPK